jgi:hypothetical protein
VYSKNRSSQDIGCTYSKSLNLRNRFIHCHTHIGKNGAPSAQPRQNSPTHQPMGATHMTPSIPQNFIDRGLHGDIFPMYRVLGRLALQFHLYTYPPSQICSCMRLALQRGLLNESAWRSVNDDCTIQNTCMQNRAGMGKVWFWIFGANMQAGARAYCSIGGLHRV